MDRTRSLIRLAKDGDKNARDKVVEENLLLVRSVVKRFLNRGYEEEDLFQVGCIGLIKSIDHFDLNYDVKFSTYAVPVIMGEIKRFMRDDGMIKVSRSLKETARKAVMTKEKMEKEKGMEIGLSEIADELRMPMEEVVFALLSSQEVESLHKTIYNSDGSEMKLMDKLKEDKDIVEDLMNKMTLSDLIKGLDERERRIIEMRYYESKTQTEIAEELMISQVQVSRIEKRVLIRLREQLC